MLLQRPRTVCLLQSFGLMNASPAGYYSQAIWEFVHCVTAAKAGVPDMYLNSFQGDTGDLGVSYREKVRDVYTLALLISGEDCSQSPVPAELEDWPAGNSSFENMQINLLLGNK